MKKSVSVEHSVVQEELRISSSSQIEISELIPELLNEAAHVYAQGLLMETPPGSTEPLSELKKSMGLYLRIYLQQKEDRHIWLAMVDNSICGILDFYHHPNEILIRFICAIPPRQGVGSTLIAKLAHYAIHSNIDIIRSTVSSLDIRAQKFYLKRLGFIQTGVRPEDSGFDLFLVASKPLGILRKLTKGS